MREMESHANDYAFEVPRSLRSVVREFAMTFHAMRGKGIKLTGATAITNAIDFETRFDEGLQVEDLVEFVNDCMIITPAISLSHYSDVVKAYGLSGEAKYYTFNAKPVGGHLHVILSLIGNPFRMGV